jgi:DNA-binding transcriptional ArsR family regulator
VSPPRPPDELRIIRDPHAIKIGIEDTRRKILALLKVNPLTVAQIATALGKDQSTIYRHMEKLQDADLVEVAGERKEHHIPEKIFRRTAKVFLIAPEVGALTDELDLLDTYVKEQVRRLLRILKDLGHLETLDDDLVARTQELLLHIDAEVRGELDRARVEEQLELHTIWRLETILLLLALRRNPDLRDEMDAILSRFTP